MGVLKVVPVLVLLCVCVLDEKYQHLQNPYAIKPVPNPFRLPQKQSDPPRPVDAQE